MLKIDELITILKNTRYKLGDIEVCKLGHYGEIVEMSYLDVGIDKVISGRDKGRTVFNLDTPDIGPEPD